MRPWLFAAVGVVIAAWMLPSAAFPQHTSEESVRSAPLPSETPDPPSPSEPIARRFRMEITSFDNAVSNGFGQWWGSGLHLSYRPSARWTASGQLFWQHRPGQSERLFGIGTLVHWTPWFSTDLAVSGGGPDKPEAFFPQLRYDLTANLKLPPLPGLILTGGLTRLYFGTPNNGRVTRFGAIYYWDRFVFQGTLYFNNARPGNRKSKSVSGAVQYGQEGRYWAGWVAGGGREAWQTLSLTPQDVEFSSYSTSLFFRKWLTPSYGVALSYGYSVKRAAYRIHGLEMKFFLDF
ncbi:MAG: YaiO family outer membrane beta-barrel protein [Acidobacteria bacterium]|nr:YaiO family outer membrane beta-barrel protein [Acidobacteriota bacterium]